MFKDLKGKILKSIEGKVGDNKMAFITKDGRRFVLYHEQDCCEDVTIEDIDGDLDDLLNSKILMARESCSDKNPKGFNNQYILEYQDSFTWTFYKLRTMKGSVTIRWYVGSNGYYSEEVGFIEVKK